VRRPGLAILAGLLGLGVGIGLALSLGPLALRWGIALAFPAATLLLAFGAMGERREELTHVLRFAMALTTGFLVASGLEAEWALRPHLEGQRAPQAAAVLAALPMRYLVASLALPIGGAALLARARRAPA
jgi:hypothetical protein